MSRKKVNINDAFWLALGYINKNQKVTQAKISELTGVARSRISEILGGSYSTGRILQEKIAKGLGYDLVDFLTLGRELADGAQHLSLSPAKQALIERITQLDDSRINAITGMLDAFDADKGE